MAYEKQEFVNKSTKLKAEHLQHIEDGIIEVEASVPASAEVDEESGYAHFKNAAGITLFTLDLAGLGGDMFFGNVVISAESVEVAEGATNTFNVYLETAPSHNQPVYLAVSDNTRLSVSPASLTFTPDNYAIPQTVTVTALQDDDESDDSVTVTLTSRKVDPRKVVVTIGDDDKPQLVTDGLVFNLELRGRTAENDPANPPTITDTVGGLVCTPYNIDWDGETSGFVENGLLLKDYSSFASPNQYNETTYSTLGVPPLPDVDFTNGVTIEICANPEKQSLVRFFAGTANGATLYPAINPGTAGSYAQNFTDINGSNNAGLYTVYGSSDSFYDGTGYDTGEHIYTYTYSPAGVLSHYLDGVFLGSKDYNSNADFDHFNLPDVLKTMKAGYIGSFENGTKDRQMVVSEYRTYNRVLSADEIRDNYKVTASRQTATNF